MRPETQSHKASPLRPSTTSSSRATRPVRSTMPVTKRVERYAVAARKAVSSTPRR
jgi:hypothetical protein